MELRSKWMSALLVLAVLSFGALAGCGKKETVSSDPMAAQAANSPAQKEGNDTAAELQGKKERQMVMLFQGLLMLDRNPDTAITKTQASSMLPIVKKSVEEGQIDSAGLKAVVGQLTPEQKAAFDSLTDRATRFAEAGGQGGGPLANLTEEEKEKLRGTIKNRMSGEGMPRDEKRQPGGRQNGNSGAEGENPRRPTGEWTGMGQNPEQQLIELLESK